jgi:hypothetical protein
MPKEEKIKFFYFSKFAIRIYNLGKSGWGKMELTVAKWVNGTWLIKFGKILE